MSSDLWTWLSTFEMEISSQSARLYRNARQQVKVTVVIEPNRGELTDDEKRSVTLIDYRTSAPLAPDTNAAATWMQGAEYKGYDYFPEPGRGVMSHQRGAGSLAKTYLDFYVSTRAAAGEVFQIGAQITRRDGLIVRSNNIHEGGDYDHIHDFSVRLTSVALPSFTVANYEWEKERVDGGGGDWVFKYIDNYYLRAHYDGTLLAPLRSMEVTPAGMIQWQDKNPGETFASYTGYGEPGGAAARYNPAIVLGGAHQPPGQIKQPKQGFGVIALVADGNIPYHSESANNHNGPCSIQAVDVYGNEHRLRVRFESGTDRHNLRLEAA